MAGEDQMTTDFVTTRPPTPHDDLDAGYQPGDFWSLPHGPGMWHCADNAKGRAAWQPLKLGASYPVGAIGGAPPCAAYGTRRLAASYTGPLMQVVHPKTLAASDIFALPDGDIDRAALIIAMAGANHLRVAILYDQSGHGNDAVQPVPANRPAISPAFPLAASLAVLFDGEGRKNPPVSRFLNLPGTLAWPSGTESSQLAIASFRSWFGHIPHISRLANAAGDGGSAATWGCNGGRTYYVSVGQDVSCTLNIPHCPRAPLTPFVTGYTSTPSTTRLWLDNAAITKNAGSAPAVKGGSIGVNTNNIGTSLDLSALLIYDRALTLAEQATANAALYRCFNLAPQIRDTILAIGDSITEGYGCQLNQNWPRQMVPLLKTPYVVSNAGVFGTHLTGLLPLLTPGYFKQAFHGAERARKIVLLFMGTNDLNGNKPARLVYEAVKSLVERVHAFGGKIFVCTILPSGAFPNGGEPPGAKEAQRLALNSMIRDNDAGADAIVDVASDPVLGSYENNNQTYFQDRIHPVSFPTFGMIAAHFAAAINRMQF
jgi:lysophospholipase L1-like esterase